MGITGPACSRPDATALATARSCAQVEHSAQVAQKSRNAALNFHLYLRRRGEHGLADMDGSDGETIFCNFGDDCQPSCDAAVRIGPAQAEHAPTDAWQRQACLLFPTPRRGVLMARPLLGERQ